MPTTNHYLRRGLLASAVIVLILLIDQIVKIWIKTSFYLGEDFEIFSWFHLHFIQNNGMAFGFEFGSKLLLTLFRIVLVAFLLWYLYKVIHRPKVRKGYLISLALIIAGAFGNIIDCIFYGLIFTNPAPLGVAELVPLGQGYGTWFHGLVVDMLYFPLFEFNWPTWMPIIGNSTFSFFDPVFNIADAAISVGVVLILLFYHKDVNYSIDNEAETQK